LVILQETIEIRKSEDEKEDWNMETISSQLGSSNNRFAMLSRVTNNISCYNLNNRNMLKEVIVKIGLEKIDIQKGVVVEVLLNNRTHYEFRVYQEIKI